MGVFPEYSTSFLDRSGVQPFCRAAPKRSNHVVGIAKLGCVSVLRNNKSFAGQKAGRVAGQAGMWKSKSISRFWSPILAASADDLTRYHTQTGASFATPSVADGRQSDS